MALQDQNTPKTPEEQQEEYQKKSHAIVRNLFFHRVSDVGHHCFRIFGAVRKLMII